MSAQEDFQHFLWQCTDEHLTVWYMMIYLNGVSNCCITLNKKYFSYIMARTNYFLMRWWWCLLCTGLTCLAGFLLFSLRVDMSLHLCMLSWLRANQSLLLLLNTTCLEEKQQIQILKSLVWADSLVDYRIRGEHSNHYITDALYLNG